MHASIECIATIDVHTHVTNRSTKETVLICKGQQGLLLAWCVSRDLGIIPNDYPKQVCAMKHPRSQLSPPKNGTEQHVHAIAINSSRMTVEDDKDDTTNHLPSEQREVENHWNLNHCQRWCLKTSRQTSSATWDATILYTLIDCRVGQ